jgi:chorismate lyase/3-hydroxybenzoate synthase
MALESGLQVDYLPLAEHDLARWDGVLGVATFDSIPPSLEVKDVPVADIRTPVLGPGGEFWEIWRTGQRLESGQRAGVRYRHGAEILFGCISVPEADVPGQRGKSGLHAATERAYLEIFATLDELAYPHLLRVWNYVPEINADTHGMERYRQFNSARRVALIACGRDLAGNVPAACALGSAPGSPLVIYFLASRKAPTLIENPRQTSAYHYPSQYGPKPAFSRASVLQESHGAILFISGTASIVGHRTVHAGDVAAQTRETLANVEALLGEANRVVGPDFGAPRFDLETLAYKVYVRNSADLPVIQSQLRAVLGSQAQLMYLRADICRQDLLVEVEATSRDAASIAA